LVIDSMGAGFTLGTPFDNGISPTGPAEIFPILDLYPQASMRHVRIPVTWLEGFDGHTLADAQGNLQVDHPRLMQLDTVINYALQLGLYVVINAHHERTFKQTYDGSPAMDDISTTLWRGIARRYQAYPHHLIFELLNEPNGSFGEWNGEGPKPFDPQALTCTRHIFQIGHEAVRATGGGNAYRLVMIATNGLGTHTTIEEVYPLKEHLPGKGEDPYLAIQVHSYNPWSFCGQEGNNDEYPGKSSIEASLRQVAAHSRSFNVPINYGEFGVGRATNTEERNTDLVKEYYRTMILTCREEKMSSTVWDDRGWFALISRNEAGEYQFVYDLVSTMLAP
jgi:endoglucanase